MFTSIPGYEGKYSISESGEVMNDKTGKLLKLVHAGSMRRYLFCSIYDNGKQTTCGLHRLLAMTFLKDWDPNLHVDHINGDTYDNRLSNLRMVTRAENLQNQKRAKGCTWDKNKGKWQARISANKKTISLGYHDTEEEAKQAYLNAKKIYHPSAPAR